MARFIDADELIAQLKTQYGEELGWQCTVNMSDVGMMIEDAPTVDAVEVVRCKDCRMFVHNKEAFVTYCKRELKDLYARPDGYCSYGERKKANNG